MAERIEDRARLDFIRYASCWEDAAILVEALRPEKGKRILSIASAGDNALALLAGGASVVAVDLNPAQLACVALKRAAFSQLSYDELLAFLGVLPHPDRLSVFARLSDHLPPAAVQFWSANRTTITKGCIHGGKFERYFHLFRRAVLPFVASPPKIAALLTERTEEERAQFYHTEWNTWRWRTVFRVFFGRTVMGLLGRDPEFFRYVEGPVGEQILSRVSRAFTTIPVHDNPYLRYILTGNFHRDALPRYLRHDHYEPIRAHLAQLTIVQGRIDEVATTHREDGFDGYNLSDIFEYLSDDLSASVYGALVRSAKEGARLAYWNMLVPRGVPEALTEEVRALTSVAESLFSKDKAPFYRSFHVDEVQRCSPG